MEEYGDKYMRKMDSFLKTMITRVNRSTGKAPKNVTKKNFLSIFSETQLTNISDHVLMWAKMFVYQKTDIQFRKGYKSQFTNEIFKIVKVATYKPPTYNFCGE